MSSPAITKSNENQTAQRFSPLDFMTKLASEPSKKSILIAEDHESIAVTYRLFLESLGYEVLLAVDGEACIEIFEKNLSSQSKSLALPTRSIGRTYADNSLQQLCQLQVNEAPFEIIILDYHLPSRDGMDIAKYVKSKCPQQRVVIASSYPASTISKSADAAGICLELLAKPFGLDVLVNLLEGNMTLDIVGRNTRFKEAM